MILYRPKLAGAYMPYRAFMAGCTYKETQVRPTNVIRTADGTLYKQSALFNAVDIEISGSNLGGFMNYIDRLDRDASHAFWGIKIWKERHSAGILPITITLDRDCRDDTDTTPTGLDIPEVDYTPVVKSCLGDVCNYAITDTDELTITSGYVGSLTYVEVWYFRKYTVAIADFQTDVDQETGMENWTLLLRETTGSTS